MPVRLVLALALTGCATTLGPPGEALAQFDHPSLASCTFEAAGEVAVWRCPPGRLVDARVGVTADNASGIADALAATHPTLSRPQFSRTDANTLAGDPIRLTMLGYVHGLALVATEAGGRGRAVTCLVTGEVSELAAEAPQWCKPKMAALWKAL